MSPESKAFIADWALYLADKNGLSNVSRSRVAAQCKVADATVSNAFNGMDGLLGAVIELAVKKRKWRVVAEGLALRHPVALGLSRAAKRKAMEALL